MSLESIRGNTESQRDSTAACLALALLEVDIAPSSFMLHRDPPCYLKWDCSNPIDLKHSQPCHKSSRSCPKVSTNISVIIKSILIFINNILVCKRFLNKC